MSRGGALDVYLASPRGFCAGVERAVSIVEEALARYGAPVYVRHAIVHNAHVVRNLQAKGAIFVPELADIPDTTRPVIFSAHGVARSVHDEAAQRRLRVLDATCPLVHKVHAEARTAWRRGHHLVLIGHAGHAEVIGTLGQIDRAHISLVETVEDVENLVLPAGPVTYVTQTTLSLDETAAIRAALHRKFPHMQAPRKEDICYATTNRQSAVKAIAASVQLMLVVGTASSSNSMRLVEVARRYGCPRAMLVEDYRQLPWPLLGPCRRLGLTAGASTPQELMTEILEALRAERDIRCHETPIADENIHFRLPPELERAEDGRFANDPPTS